MVAYSKVLERCLAFEAEISIWCLDSNWCLCPHKAFGVWRLAFGVRRSAFVLVLVLVLVLERCCLQKRRVNPITITFPELRPRSGLKGAHPADQNRPRASAFAHVLVVERAFPRPRDEADLSGRQYRAWASSDRLRSKSGLG